MAFGQVKNRKRKKPRILPDLPEFYYHTNFCEMLTFVADRYTHVFECEHFNFVADFEALPWGAQCLYVRLAGRKGCVFDTGKLPYAEISDVPAALRALELSGFIAPIDETRYADCLSVMTKPDLISFMADHMCTSGFKRSWKKSLLVDAALAHIPFKAAQVPVNFIAQARAEPMLYLSYLHFGKIEENLQSFTLRDLGIRKVPDFKADYSARFESLDEAKSAYFYDKGLHRFKHGTDEDVAMYVDTVDRWPSPHCDISLSSRDKLLQKLGGLSERLGDVDTALGLYGRSDAPLCNERTIRLRYARGDKTWCQSRLEALIENPGNDDEYHFAADFYARKYKKKRTSAVTDILRGGELIDIDEAFKTSPEGAVAGYYRKRGYAVYFTENDLWRTLFGLLFWQELYCVDVAAIHSRFDRMPASIKTGAFYVENKARIENILSNLISPTDTHIQILRTVSQYHGVPNGIFRWNGHVINHVKTLIDTAPCEALSAILRQMAMHYKTTKDGFPDLMLIKEGTVKFIEVKASGDVIRRNQLTRIKQLRAAGFQTDIARINWIVDPSQIYVVVDVETTGGRPGNHRMTEIGAVKVQNGHIIEEFQTLLNPERAIPSFITNLTGITNEMVRDAPRFADIADDFKAFMGEAIFAAHNVNFDYGFVKSEYARLGESFRHAKICTCASMRKFYPGYKSYGLKNLCEEFHISLETHHRALYDAKAAAELLFLVNDKRVGQRA